MGKAGNKVRAQSRRFREAEARLKKEYREAIKSGETAGDISEKEYIAAKKRAEEQMALEAAYGQAELDGDFKDDTPPWEALEDPAFNHEDAKAGPPRKEKEVVEAEKEKEKEDVNRYKVTLLKDTTLEYPILGMQVYLNLASQFEAPSFIEMLTRAGCMKARDLDEADLVIFGGGPDVDPSYYGVASKHPSTRPKEELDTKDVEIYYQCYSMGIPMVGICRGAQFLHVMNGGKLWQDVDNHNRAHTMTDLNTGEILQRVPSVHHQMCFDNQAGGQEIIAVSHVSRNRWYPENVKDIRAEQIDDIEAFFYRDTCCLGFQGHPEYKGFNYYTKWCIEQIEKNIVHNHHCEWDNGYYRIRDEYLNKRDNK